MSAESRRRILFVVLSDSGHLNPMIGIAQALEHSGCEVVFASTQNDVTPRVRRAGLTARCVLAHRSPPSADASAERLPDQVTATMQFRRRIQNATWLRHWLSKVLLDSVPEQLSSLESIIAEWRPDALCVDPMIYSGAI